MQLPLREPGECVHLHHLPVTCTWSARSCGVAVGDVMPHAVWLRASCVAGCKHQIDMVAALPAVPWGFVALFGCLTYMYKEQAVFPSGESVSWQH